MMVYLMNEPTAQSLPQLSQSTITNPAPWEQFRRPFVRDLAFAIVCPNMLTHWIDTAPNQNTPPVFVHSEAFWQAQFDAYQTRLVELDSTTAYQDLTRFLLKRPSPNRLGFHFEGLIHFWLQDGFENDCHPFEVIANNVQLYRDKQTTGELDLIIKNHERQSIEHWELAIKFFMGSAPFLPENWVGINSNDNLQRKMSHMQCKQFRSVWVDTPNHGQVKIDQRFAVIKGRFFLPILTMDFDSPKWMTPNFPLHRWFDSLDTAQLAKLQNASLRRAHYVEWFTQRPFYEQKSAIDVLNHPATGLYFLDDTPLVVCPATFSTKP